LDFGAEKDERVIKIPAGEFYTMASTLSFEYYLVALEAVVAHDNRLRSDPFGKLAKPLLKGNSVVLSQKAVCHFHASWVSAHVGGDVNTYLEYSVVWFYRTDIPDATLRTPFANVPDEF
tara:strand:+ start:1954 stop:2310 length:357 start_codon:yes stop_codon:yes gene_type:complete